MARGGRRELLLPRVLEAHRASDVERGKGNQVLGDHLLLSAETAADALREHPQLIGPQVEQVRQLDLGNRRRLGAGPHDKPTILHPADGPMGLQMGMLNTRGEVGSLVDHVCFGESRLDVADFAVKLKQDVALGIANEWIT